MLETPSRIEPCFFEDSVPTVLADLSVELQKESSEMGRNLHPDTAYELSDMVRLMNCYYSNLIEGHNTRPKDIEKALAGQAIDPERRSLALEAKAHVVVQRQIDELYLNGKLPSPTSIDFIKWIHFMFYNEMPDEFRFIERADGTRIEIVPGEFRKSSSDDVTVGNHFPPSSERVNDFMEHFSKRFGAAEKWASTKIIAIASAHHRFNYIHPFPDGNGRVSRLMSHAMALNAGIGGHGLWSISRGLARGLKERGEYMSMMNLGDSPRRGALDGRGNLSEAALKDFCEWFLTVALDQIRFSANIFDLDNLENRYRSLINNISEDKRAPDLISAALKYGALDRGDAHIVLKTSERTARNTLSALVRDGFLKSDTSKSPVRIAFPLDFREKLFPNLFTDNEISAPETPSLSFR